MKKYLWLVGLISLFALGQMMVPLSQAQDDNVTIPIAKTIIKGDGIVDLPCRILVPGSNDSFAVIPGLATTPEWAAGNQAIVNALLAGKFVTETTIDMDGLAASLGLGPGVYAFNLPVCNKGSITYFLLPSNLASRADLVNTKGCGD